MKVFVQADKNGLPHNHNFYSAYQGFLEMGFETIMFNRLEELKDSNRNDIVIGYVDDVRKKLSYFGVTPPEIDYPEELKAYLGRKIWRSKLSHVANNPEQWPIFIKPIEDKKFSGVVVHSPKNLIGCGTCGEDPEIFCSEVVNFKAEWRCFVRYGRILDVRPYRGEWRLHYAPTVIEKAVSEYKTAPNGFAIDFGLTNDGRTLLIEVNDGYALGSYGLFYLDYAKLLSSRWAELTKTQDECAFDIHYGKYN